MEYIEDDIVNYEGIRTVVDIDDLVTYELTGINYKVNAGMISGVPLTSTILEDNGWEKDRSGAMKYYKKVNERLLFCLRATPDGWTLRCGNQDLLEKIEFVHQLQHLLFGLHINSEMKVSSNRPNKK